MLDNRDIITLTNSMEKQIERTLDIELRSLKQEIDRIKNDVQQLRSGLETLSTNIANLGSVIKELRQESEQAKQHDFGEETDLRVVKDQLVRMQSDLQVISNSIQHQAAKQPGGDRGDIFP